MQQSSRHGERSLTDAARDLVNCAAQHPMHYTPPSVVFWFASGVFAKLAAQLQAVGVMVKGQLVTIDPLRPIKALSNHDDGSEDDDKKSEHYDDSEIEDDIELRETVRELWKAHNRYACAIENSAGYNLVPTVRAELVRDHQRNIPATKINYEELAANTEKECARRHTEHILGYRSIGTTLLAYDGFGRDLESNPCKCFRCAAQ